MTKTWIEPIFDRTYGDVTSVQMNPDQINPKGCWNAVDLNRIENNTAYCAEWMLENKIVHTAPAITPPAQEWTGDIIPTQSEIARILNNVRLLVTLSSTNPAIANQLPTIYAGTQINYVLANQIEYALYLMHDQPRLPLEYWNVTIGNGVITTVVRDDGTTERINASTALVAEDEIVTIRGVEYGEYSHYQTFTYWSGTAADLGLLADDEAQETTFTMPYRDVGFTANFETHIPRTLTITNGYISVNKDPTATTGPSTAQYFAGEEIMIIATVAPSGKSFYEWTGTQEGLNNIVGVTDAEDPSTALLTMPDCDVTLAPRYINAGQHYVTVNNGTGSGYYNYNDTVYISANVPSHYAFSHWSGNTSYLTNINSSFQSFTMKDSPLTFTANFTYVYSYNSVQVIDGLITVNGSNVSQANNLRQSTSYTLVPTPPDNTQGLYSWTVEGYGSVSGNTFTVGDGNAIITGNYRPYRTLTVTNRNNGNGTDTYTAVQGKTWTVTTNSVVNTNYKFNGWYENGSRISTSTTLTLTAGENDRTVEARYDYYPTYTVTVINRNNGGSTTTTDVVSGNNFNTSTTEDVGSYLFTGWTGDKSSSSTNISFTVANNVTITANYRAKESYTLTVENGTGSGTYLERQAISVVANTPAAGASFTGWTITSGSLYQNPSSNSSTTVKLGRSNATIRANYSNIRDIRIITNSSDNTYTMVQGTSRNISAGTAPSTYEFNHWEVTSGDATLANQYASSTTVYANSQDSTITAKYTPIPRFTVTMVDGYVWNGSEYVESASLLRNSTNAITLKQGSVPTGYQFLQWEVYENGVLQTNADDVYEPFAETTRLRNLLRNITIKATFYIPDPTVLYTLTVHRKDGSTNQYTNPVGTNINISASSPDQGKEFYKWTGDVAYVAGGVYNANTYVLMPAQNIEITETYVNEGYIPEFDLVMTNLYGECCYTTESEDPETGEIITTDHWVTRHSYQEGTEVRIRTTSIPNEYYFSSWDAVNHDTEADARSIITSLNSANTTLTMPNYDVDAEPIIALKTTYELRVNGGYTGGRTSANYYEGAKADIYFGPVDTNDIHYQFTRWTGTNISQLELWDGGMFNVLTPGTESSPQYIKMPGRAVEVTATYKTLYKLTLTNATIDTTGETTGYYESGMIVNITADTPASGLRFQYWTGDVNRISNKYDPTTAVTIDGGIINLTAVYSNDADRNDIGYTTTDLKETTTINNNNITIISGQIEVGFIITDINGHIYVITAVDTQNDTSTIYRMTKIVRGGNVYG